MADNLCIIPARGGSKRIPRKNIKFFLGKPIIAYSINAAINSGLFKEVMVSTDDLEIAKVAKELGASVPFLRSAGNADDYASTADVLLEVIKEYKTLGKEFNQICCIYPTAPFVTSDLLKKASSLLNNENFDCVFPVIPFSFPIQRALKIENSKLKFLNPEFEKTRSQDLDKTYHDAGQFYYFNTKVFKSKRSLITDNTGSIIIDELKAQDIDNEIDWKLAEIKYQQLYS